MNILVCLKNVPETAEVELEIIDSGESVETDDLAFGINEWDNYALEEALRIREAQGGSLMVVTLGDEEAEDVLRRALAMGADQAMHLCDDLFDGSDPATVAKILARSIEGRELDLVFTGVQSSDLGNSQTGVLLAQELGWPHATMAKRLDIIDGGKKIEVVRELEANTQERIEMPLPAVITIQSGINKPRYVSIMGIRKVRKKPIDQREADDLDLNEEEVGLEAAIYRSRTLKSPPMSGEAVIFEGNRHEVCAKAAQMIREKGGLR